MSYCRLLGDLKDWEVSKNCKYEWVGKKRSGGSVGAGGGGYVHNEQYPPQGTKMASRIVQNTRMEKKKVDRLLSSLDVWQLTH